MLIKIKIIIVSLIFCFPNLIFAADLFDLRVFPDFNTSKVEFAGTITTGSLKEDPSSKRSRLKGLFGEWMASDSVQIFCENRHVSARVKNGEFSGQLQVKDLKNFRLKVLHRDQIIYSEVFKFPQKADFLVVSDIDDTILLTEVSSMLKMTYNSMLKDFSKRKAIEGTPELYRQFSQNCKDLGKPHFIYLSSSPAFLSRSLKSFLRRHSFPQGTIILKKSLENDGHENHKSSWLKKISARYPGRPMILLGDSGEKDPEIYRDFHSIPGNSDRIKAVIIHEVTKEAETISRLDIIKKSMGKTPFIYWSSAAELKKLLLTYQLLKE